MTTPKKEKHLVMAVVLAVATAADFLMVGMVAPSSLASMAVSVIWLMEA